MTSPNDLNKMPSSEAMNDFFDQHTALQELRAAVAMGRVDDVRISVEKHPFLVRLTPQYYRLAIGNSHDDVLDCLIGCGAVDLRNLGLVAAIEYDRSDLIERLIPSSRPKSEKSYVLNLAVRNRNLEAAQILLPYCNAKAEHSIALRSSYEIEDKAVREAFVELLYDVSNPSVALKRMASKSKGWALLNDKIQQQQLRATLIGATEHVITPAPTRKM